MLQFKHILHNGYFIDILVMIHIFQPTNKCLGVQAKETCNEASCKVSVNLAWQFQRRCFFKAKQEVGQLLLLLLLINRDPLLYFCRRLPKEASCKVSLNLDWQFQRCFYKAKQKVGHFVVVVIVDQSWPLVVFLQNVTQESFLSSFIEFGLVVSEEMFLMQNRKSPILLLLLLLINHDPLLYFCRGTPKEASCEVSLNLAMQFQRCFFKQVLMDVCTDGGQQLALSTVCCFLTSMLAM